MSGRGGGGRGRGTDAPSSADSPAPVGSAPSVSAAAGGRGGGMPSTAAAAPPSAGRGGGRGTVPSASAAADIGSGVSRMNLGGDASASSAASGPDRQPPSAQSVANVGKMLGKLAISSKSKPRILGTAGTACKIATNHYRFQVQEPDKKIYKYVFDYEPDIGGYNLREEALDSALKTYFGREVPYLFEFMHVYTNEPLETEQLQGKAKGNDFKISAKKVEQFLARDMPMNVLNLVVKLCERKMNLVPIGFNNYDPTNRQQLKDQYRDLYMWLGYKTAVLMRDGGPMLEVELCFKVVPTTNIYKQWNEFSRTPQGRNSTNPKRDFENAIKGRIALAFHNNRTYRIDGIVWDTKPNSTFSRRDAKTGREVKVTFRDYFKGQHGIDLDDAQFMLTYTDPRQQLIEQQRQRAQQQAGAGGPGRGPAGGAAGASGGGNGSGSSSSSSNGERHRSGSGESGGAAGGGNAAGGAAGGGAVDVKLIPPEVLVVTGLTDFMRKDFMLMRQMITIAQIAPAARVQQADKYIQGLTQHKPYAMLAAFGIRIEPTIQRMNARQLPAPVVVFNERSRTNASSGEFDRQLKECRSLLDPKPIKKWYIIFFGGGPRGGGDRGLGEQLGQELMRLGETRFNMRISAPLFMEVPSNRVNDLRVCLQAAQKEDPEMVVLIMPTKRDDYYTEFKQIMCRPNQRYGGPIPSQAVLSKTLDPKKFSGVAVKLLWQINCKLGGSLWHVAMEKLPKDTMVVGVDVYHGATGEAREAVVGVVASLDPLVTKYKSKVAMQGAHEEVSTILYDAIEEAIKAFVLMNHTAPKNIIVFRDGVSDGQLDMVKGMEVDHIKNGLKRFLPNDMPNFFYCVVQKRINLRIFADKTPRFDNPSTGTVIDHTVTRQDMFDFYIVPQAAKQGTVAPTHLIVLQEPNSYPGGNAADMLQSVAYNLTFNYANWPGAVRVPSPVQYAHKLVSLVGQTLRRATPDERLSDKLYYL